MSCPLCSNTKSIAVRQYGIPELRGAWLSSFGIDPYPDLLGDKKITKKRCMTCQLQYFEPAIYGDADFYSKLSQYPWYYEDDKWEYDVATEVVARIEPSSLLEVGCGSGAFLVKIEGMGTQVEGVDINPDAISACKAKGLKVEAADIFEIRQSYDAVVLFQVLEHMSDLERLFEFLTTKLVRPDGHIIIAVPNPDGFLKEMGINLLDMPPHHNSCWSFATFEYLASRYGLQLVEYKKEPLRYVHYLGLMQDMLRKQATLSVKTLKGRLFNKLQSLILRLFLPLTYWQARERIDGQTHLVVFKNGR